MSRYEPKENQQSQQEIAPMGSERTGEEDEMLQELWQAFLEAGSETGQLPGHLPDDVLYNLALDELSCEQREDAQGHVAACVTCRRRFGALEAALAADRAVYAVWDPEILHAAGSEQSPSAIKYPTPDGKYLMTLQPTRDGHKDLLTLEVMPAFQETLNSRKVLLVSSQGTVVLHGTISGGNITRLVDQKLRGEWPFRIQAG
jgi:hypothetical protein